MEQFKILSWNIEKYNILKEWLYSNSDLKYREFQQRIVKTKFPIVGVKIPKIRNVAKQILKGNAESFLKVCRDETFEEIILHGIVISKLKINFKQLINIFEQYVNTIDNWAVCDIVTGSIKSFFKNKITGYEYILKCIYSNNPWKVRVGIVALISFYVDEEYIFKILDNCKYISDRFSKIKTKKLTPKYKLPHYYVKMANAWLISMCFIKFPKITKNFFKTNELENETFNMAVQKIIDSTQVSKQDKIYVKNEKKLHNNIKQGKE